MGKLPITIKNKDYFTALGLMAGYHTVMDLNYFVSSMKHVFNTQLTKNSLGMEVGKYFSLKSKFGIAIDDDNDSKRMNIKYENIEQKPFILISRTYANDFDRIVNLLHPTMRIQRTLFETLYRKVYNADVPHGFMDYLQIWPGDVVSYKHPLVNKKESEFAQAYKSFENENDMKKFVRRVYRQMLKANDMNNALQHFDVLEVEEPLLDVTNHVENNEDVELSLEEEGEVRCFKTANHPQVTVEPVLIKEPILATLYAMKFDRKKDENEQRDGVTLTLHQKFIADTFNIHSNNYREFQDFYKKSLSKSTAFC